jgi:8-oxo-dGTP pyrophosphatase MutT (NUDIX family)
MSRSSCFTVAHHCGVADPLRDAVRAHRPHDGAEAADLARLVALVESAPDPWSRTLPLHVTASALVVHPPTGRVLLRWHAKQERWLQVGGHGDPGERDPWLVALREAEEETGLTDLTPLETPLEPRTRDGLDAETAQVHTENEGGSPIFQVTVVSVNPAAGEPPHEHADIRYLLTTGSPGDAPAEREGVALRWFSLAEALEVADEGLARLLRRIPGAG